MKKIIYLIVLLPILVVAQTTTENFTKTTAYKVPTLTSIATPTKVQADQNILYYNGLGRPMQQIQNQESPSGKDIIKPIVYDAFGRVEKEYLPYVRTGTTLSYDSSALTNVMTFYGSPTPLSTGNPNFEATANPYTQKVYEASPLDRILTVAQPGNGWAMGLNQTVKIDYIVNVATDNVKKYKVVASFNTGTNLYDIPLTDNGFYAINKLYKTVTKNENWVSADGANNTVQEFKDNEGHLILKRGFGVSVIGTTETNTTHDTYYVYDQFGNLTYVIPPLVDTSTTLSTTVLDNLCYQYKYDSRNRLVEKKLPGKQTQFIVYDKLNRVIASGPVLSPFLNLVSPNNIGWMVSKYDALNRVILTGWMPSTTVTSAGRNSLQLLRNADTILNETKNPTATDNVVSGITLRYSINAFPAGATGYYVLSVIYYDDYNYYNAPTIPTGLVANQNVYYNTTLKPKGLVTGTLLRIPELSTTAPVKTETAYSLYDIKSRPIQGYTRNYLYGFTQVDTNYETITGRVNYTITTHSRATTTATITVRDDYSYTAQDRLLAHTQSINGATPAQLINENTYDELGQLIIKKVGNTSAIPLQKIDYTYNIRGWLTSINNDPTNNLVLNTTEKDLFAFKINYNNNNTATTYPGENLVPRLYNGNISETFWRSTDNVLRKYGYSYDNLNRLKNAVYEKPFTTIPVTNMYNESVTYDKNGNIKTLQRNGDFDGQIGAIQIDNLVYDYTASNTANQLARVTDGTNNNNLLLGFKNGTNTDDDYAYDANGNMTVDKNKGITDIKYNHLNLPTEIIFATTPSLKKINYLYNAVGDKLQKIVTSGTNITTTDYINGFQYIKSGIAAVVLQYFPTAEGYVNYDTGVYKYVYNYTDHLGNIRVSYTRNDTTGLPVIMEENHYYPFGLKHTNYNVTVLKLRGSTPVPVLVNGYKYRFNGKEYQDEQGLNMTAMDFRQYDGATGRFNTVDVLAERDHNKSPYCFARNSPMMLGDPTGFSPEGDTSDYVDGDDHNWNNGLVGNEQSTGLHDVYIFPDEMKTGTNTTGGEIKEVVISGFDSDGINGNKDDRAGVDQRDEKLETIGKLNDMIDIVANSFKEFGNLKVLENIGGNVSNITGPIGYAVNATTIGMGVQKDGGKFGTNAQIATGGLVVGIMGAEAGALVGGEAGLLLFFWAGPVAPVAGVVGAVVGGIWGGITGGEIGGGLVKGLQN